MEFRCVVVEDARGRKIGRATSLEALLGYITVALQRAAASEEEQAEDVARAAMQALRQSENALGDFEVQATLDSTIRVGDSVRATVLARVDEERLCEAETEQGQSKVRVWREEEQVVVKETPTKSGTSRLFGWGEDASGCLGASMRVDLRELAFERVREIACSARHTLVLTWHGRLYACGDNGDGACGIDGATQVASLAAVPWPDDTAVQTTAAGADVFGSQSAAVGSNGSLYTWGFGVATGHRTTKPVRAPRRLEVAADGSELPWMSAVSAGGSFCVALDQGGRAFSWGVWAGGRLGLGNAPWITASSSRSRPRDRQRQALHQLSPRCMHDGDDEVKAPLWRRVACGEAHCLAVTLADGRLYAWGQNSYGQLGLGDDLSCNEPKPRRVLAPSRVRDVACGPTHSVAIDSNGDAWTWGGGPTGCSMLGHGDRLVPALVTTTADLMTRRVLDGRPSRSRHHDDCCWAWPRRLETLAHVRKASCGERHTAFLTESSTLFACGDGVATASKDNTLCTPHTPNVAWLPELQATRITNVSCGGQHTLAVASAVPSTNLWPQLYETLIEAAADFTSSDDELYASLAARGIDCLLIPGGGDPVCAHRAVLAKRSATFAERILLEQREDGRKHAVLELLVPELSPAVARAMVEFVYCDDLFETRSFRPSFLAELANAATNFQLPKLARICKDRLSLADEDDDDDHERAFVRDATSLVGDSTYSDATFMTQRTTIAAHRFVLATASDYFRAMFASGMRESVDVRVEVPDTPETMRRLLTFLYADVLPESEPDQVLKDLVAADRYGLQRMKRTCESTLAMIAARDNVAQLVDVLRVAQAVRAPALRKDMTLLLARQLDSVAAAAADIEEQDILRDVCDACILTHQTASSLQPPDPNEASNNPRKDHVLQIPTAVLSLPHAVGLLVLCLLCIVAQRILRLRRPYAVALVNTAFVVGLVLIVRDAARAPADSSSDAEDPKEEEG